MNCKPEREKNKGRSCLLFFLTLFFVFSADRLSKFFVKKFLSLNDSTSLWGQFLRLTYVKNQGIVFGLLPWSDFLLIILSIIAIFTVIIFLRVYEKNSWVSLSTGLILGGGLGNLLDRIREGAVTDFLDFSFWPVFNLADLAICLGIGMAIWGIINSRRKTMRSSVLSQIEKVMDHLSREEQLWLIEQLAHHLQKDLMKSNTVEQAGFESQVAAMAMDPEIRAELQKIDREFAVTEADGLASG